MLANGAGAFSSVIEAINLNTLSFAAIIEQFGNLPATSQAALVMAVLSAFIIPIGALVAGDGLAALALERRTTTDTHEQAWQEVEFIVIYRALYGRYLHHGIAERDAHQKAYGEVRGYLGKGSISPVRQLSAPNGQTGQCGSGQGSLVKARVHAYLDANSSLDQLSVNQVLTALKEAGVQAECTTVAEVLQERKTIKVDIPV